MMNRLVGISHVLRMTYVLGLLLEGLEGLNTSLVLQEVLDKREKFSWGSHCIVWYVFVV